MKSPIIKLFCPTISLAPNCEEPAVHLVDKMPEHIKVSLVLIESFNKNTAKVIFPGQSKSDIVCKSWLHDRDSLIYNLIFERSIKDATSN